MPVPENPFPICIYLFRLGGGGAENIMVKLANSFVRAGHPTKFLVNRRGGVFEDRLDAEVALDVLDAARNVSCLPRLTAYLKAHRPPLVLSALAYTNAVMAMARHFSGIETRLVISERNTLSAWLNDRPTWRRPIDRQLLRRIYPMADRIVTVSNGAAHDLANIIDYPVGDIEVIFNPTIDERSWRAMEEEPTHPWLLDHGPPVIIAAGRLINQKDFPTLIEAFARMRKARAARLMILGEGPERKALEAIVAARSLTGDVALPGYVTNPLCYFRRASLFVLSSRFEGFPNVLVEALASGVPVVSTDCPSGPHEILEGGHYGPLVPVGDPESLARVICMTLDNPGDANIRIERAAEFCIERASRHYLDVFSQVMAG